MLLLAIAAKPALMLAASRTLEEDFQEFANGFLQLALDETELLVHLIWFKL